MDLMSMVALAGLAGAFIALGAMLFTSPPVRSSGTDRRDCWAAPPSASG
ncbi:MAG TPA: hypothetical protein VIK11_07995 [Tepidiformaceae bacterium]